MLTVCKILESVRLGLFSLFLFMKLNRSRLKWIKVTFLGHKNDKIRIKTWTIFKNNELIFFQFWKNLPRLLTCRRRLSSGLCLTTRKNWTKTTMMTTKIIMSEIRNHFAGDYSATFTLLKGLFFQRYSKNERYTLLE